MKLDDERLEKYLEEIAAETIDIEKSLARKAKKRWFGAGSLYFKKSKVLNNSGCRSYCRHTSAYPCKKNTTS